MSQEGAHREPAHLKLLMVCADICRLSADTMLRGAEGTVLLAQQATREANILAFNDVFLLVGVLAVAACIWGLMIRWSIKRRGEVSPVVQLQQKMAEQAAQQGGTR